MAESRDTPSERLGVPYDVGYSRQMQGRLSEKQMAKERGARLHPNSGAGRIKDDASNDADQFEFKHVLHTHGIKGVDLLALFKRATRMGKEPRYIIYFEAVDLTATITIERGKK